jgi:hypothetical protein
MLSAMGFIANCPKSRAHMDIHTKSRTGTERYYLAGLAVGVLVANGIPRVPARAEPPS